MHYYTLITMIIILLIALILPKRPEKREFDSRKPNFRRVDGQ